MSGGETEYALEPTTFRSLQEAQELTDVLEENLRERRMGLPACAPKWWRFSPNLSTTPPNRG